MYTNMLASLLWALAGLVAFCTADYVLEDDYATDEFFSLFDFFTDSDPTNGYVTYVDQPTAQSGGLISTNNGSIYMGVDHSNVASGSGRVSVRLTSKKTYTHGLIILDLSHMPGGVCGTWPAFWTVGPNWPDSGEIDIIEGVNSQLGNSMALHTKPGCSIVNNGLFSGTVATSNCDVNAANQPTNAGCAIVTPNTASFGNGFNLGLGGVYATEWTSSGISIWFFPRSAIPSDIEAGTPDPANWGSPTAEYGAGGVGCDIDDFFTTHQIVFDTTFCGDWAGSVWSVDPICGSKAPTCQSFVQNNPSAFADAYWSVNSLKVYQTGSGGDNGTFSVPVQSQTLSASASAAVPTASASAFGGTGTVPSIATPALSQIPTTGFSRGGNGRFTFTKPWGQAANFAADESASASASPTVTSAAASVAAYTEYDYVTVTAVTYEDFDFSKKEKKIKRAPAPAAVPVPAPVPAELDELQGRAAKHDEAHLLKHKRAHHNVHRHLFRNGLAGPAAGARPVDE